jgi:hypothetical protein
LLWCCSCCPRYVGRRFENFSTQSTNATYDLDPFHLGFTLHVDKQSTLSHVKAAPLDCPA